MVLLPGIEMQITISEEENPMYMTIIYNIFSLYQVRTK